MKIIASAGKHSLPAAMPAIIRAAYMNFTSFAIHTRHQAMKNGMHVNKAIFFRPNLSINGPTINEPMGRQIVTRLARMKKHRQYTKYIESHTTTLPIQDASSFVI